METFEDIYGQLNAAQRQAVDSVFGPVLVIAGPGTGKTQLLSARVANILKKTDALPQNILCLTFTENGALNMRERLTRFIGPDAYDVTIGTYHSFGRTIIGRFSEYFTDLQLERPIDELGKRQIISKIIEGVDYRSPIKQTRHHLGDLISTLSEVKRSLLSPEDLRAIATANITDIDSVSPDIHAVLSPYANRMPSKLSVAGPLFQSVHDILSRIDGSADLPGNYRPLAELAAADLERALESAESASTGQTKPLTAWKNKWLVKNRSNQFVLAGALESARLTALAGVLEQYQQALAAAGLFDFDDMILRAIDVLQRNDDVRFTLQEQYQYILLDEFQDTNAAQLQLVRLLTDNPVHEGRPNVLAVGDDDQAIYAFQGAEYSNMLDFYQMYRDTAVIPLTDNYRSHAKILAAASAVADQIGSRLHHGMKSVSKQLHAKATLSGDLCLERIEYESDLAERAGVAEAIRKLIDGGVQPSHIAVLAPKHRYLESLVPYLRAQDIPVAYEKRENILEAPVIRQLITMSELILALHHGQHQRANSLWPEVLSYDFWGFSIADIWKASWEASDNRTSWSEMLMDHDGFRHAVLLMLTLASKVTTDTCEVILDALIGTTDVTTRDPAMPSIRSPLRDHYLRGGTDMTLYEVSTQLAVLRSKLRSYQNGQDTVLRLQDLIDFVTAYNDAGEQLINTSPYHQSADAVQLQTVFKAKGLEYDHVFLLSVHDDVWGSSSGGTGNKLTLPANLAPIRHAGISEDERLRILFVALTRAKIGLHMTSHRMNYAGKRTERLKYLNEIEDGNAIIARMLPEPHRKVLNGESQMPTIETLKVDWRAHHEQYDTAPLNALLSERLASYQLSPTHLTQFIDLEYAGPSTFLLSTLLRFPSAPSEDSCFGNAIHATLEWLQVQLNATGTLPASAIAIDYAQTYLSNQPLTPEQIAVQQARAAQTLAVYLSVRGANFKQGNKPEKSFRGEGVIVDKVIHMSGNIDLLEIDPISKTICVVDYKTGTPAAKWKPETAKLHKYALQLYCYKILVENSASYRGYTVSGGRIEFVEPDGDGDLHALALDYDPATERHVRSLLAAVWSRIHALQLPDIATYGTTVSAIRQFERDLIDGTI